MNILDTCFKLQEQITGWRRYLHRYPETGTEVPLTAAFLADELEKLGLVVKRGVGGQGLTALMEGDRKEPCIAIRADMDALELEEATGLPYTSENPGKMHACGHDAHMAIALGTALALTRMKESLHGSVKFIFQPAEENIGGARDMIKAGALENPRVQAITGLHVGNIWDGLPPGTAGYKYGVMYASRDHVEIKVIGKGGHGAMPHRTVDTITTACQAVTTVQSVLSQEISPYDAAVFSVGSIQGGTSHNIIPAETFLKGTVRTLKDNIRSYLSARIPEVFENVARARRAECKINFVTGYPALYNHDGFTGFFARTARELMGKDGVVEIEKPTMGSEDMAFFLQEVPGTYFFLSTNNPDKGIIYPHHNSRFDVDEEVLWKGSALLANTAMRWLKEQQEHT